MPANQNNQKNSRPAVLPAPTLDLVIGPKSRSDILAFLTEVENTYPDANIALYMDHKTTTLTCQGLVLDLSKRIERDHERGWV